MFITISSTEITIVCLLLVYNIGTEYVPNTYTVI